MPVHDEVPFRKGQRVLVRQNWIRDQVFRNKRGHRSHELDTAVVD